MYIYIYILHRIFTHVQKLGFPKNPKPDPSPAWQRSSGAVSTATGLQYPAPKRYSSSILVLFQPANYVDSSSSKTRMLQDVTKKPGDLVAEIGIWYNQQELEGLASRHLQLQRQESCWDRRRKRCVNLGWKEGEPPRRTLPNSLPENLMASLDLVGCFLAGRRWGMYWVWPNVQPENQGKPRKTSCTQRVINHVFPSWP